MGNFITTKTEEALSNSLFSEGYEAASSIGLFDGEFQEDFTIEKDEFI